MTKIKELISNERLQYLVYIGLSIVVVGLTGIAYFSNNLIFQRFIGGINPLIASLFIIILGFIILSFLLSKGWFAIYKKGNLKGLFYSSGLAALFGLIIILVDFNTRLYPADMNILFPESLLFYPAIDLFAEILFQVLPLTLILIILTSLSKKINHNMIIWISIFAASLLEPIYQTIPLLSGQYPLWFAGFTFIHVFLIILSQLTIFKRYDFITMYWFRLVYYIIWHIVWGHIRLGLLFHS
ncbi:Uncharacterised protein [uncultured archaeon]|nr:Uncharacterised protein [uncultured archaeon]